MKSFVNMFDYSCVFRRFGSMSDRRYYEYYLQRTLILTEAGSDVPTLFLARHCRVLLSLTETLSIVKLDFLPMASFSCKSDHSYSKLTPGFDFNTPHLTVNWSPGRTSRRLDGSTATTGLSNNEILKRCHSINYSISKAILEFIK